LGGKIVKYRKSAHDQMHCMWHIWYEKTREIGGWCCRTVYADRRDQIRSRTVHKRRICIVTSARRRWW